MVRALTPCPFSGPDGDADTVTLDGEVEPGDDDSLWLLAFDITTPPKTSTGDVLILAFLALSLYPSRVWLPWGKRLSLHLSVTLFWGACNTQETHKGLMTITWPAWQ